MVLLNIQLFTFFRIRHSGKDLGYLRTKCVGHKVPGLMLGKAAEEERLFTESEQFVSDLFDGIVLCFIFVWRQPREVPRPVRSGRHSALRV
jgi:hypothetical protein